MIWSSNTLVLIGLFAGLFVIIDLSTLPIVALFGTGAGGIAETFVLAMLLILYKRILENFGSITILTLIIGILVIFFPTLGPTGFWPKIIITTVAGFIIDLVYYLLKKREKVAAIIAPMLSAISVNFLLLAFFVLLGVPGTDKFLAVVGIFTLIVAVEAPIGGLVGLVIYNKIKNKPFVRRLRAMK